MKKILFSTNFSNPANHAFSYAVKLAEDLEVTINLLHVFNAPQAALIPITDDGRKDFHFRMNKTMAFYTKIPLFVFQK